MPDVLGAKNSGSHMKKALYTLLGFLFFIFGFLSLMLSMIGVQLTFMIWLDAPGRLFGFVARLLIVIGGIVIVALANTDWERERAESAS